MRNRLFGTFLAALITAGCTSDEASQVAEAEAAQVALAAPLSSEQSEEMMDGMQFFIQHRYAEAASALSKYASLGEPTAQYFVGMMYYFGKGYPQDRAEGIRWFRLAAAQGHKYGQESLTAALGGTIEWDGPADTQVELAEIDEPVTTYGGPGYTSQQRSIDTPSVAYAQPVYGSPYGPTSRSVLDAESASSKYRSAPSPIISIPDAVVLNPSGPGQYVGSDGVLYTQAGPNGVVNTRTGQFSPGN